MGIDRWKQEHRNWRPSGVRLAASETLPDEPTAPSLVPSEKAPSAKPRAAKKPVVSSASAEKALSKRSKR